MLGIGFGRVGMMAYVGYWAWMGRKYRIPGTLGIGFGRVGMMAYVGYWSRTGRDDGIRWVLVSD
jgi:hypothetical protein